MRSKKRKREEAEVEQEKPKLEKKKIVEECKEMGASYLRFELIEVKGQKQVVPVRYSIRNGSDQMQELLRQELLNSSNIGFLPCKQLEENFRLASAAQEIRALLLQRSQKVVEVDDIEEVLELDLCGYAIVELTEEASAAKF